MGFNQYNSIVLGHRDSMILIGGVILLLCIAALVFVELYVRGTLGCKHFRFGKFRVSPTSILLIPTAAVVIYFSAVVLACNKDVELNAYETYIGNCSYTTESVVLEDRDIHIYVGKGHEIVPYGVHYGKCIYSKYAKVIVYWEPISQ